MIPSDTVCFKFR